MRRAWAAAVLGLSAAALAAGVGWAVSRDGGDADLGALLEGVVEAGAPGVFVAVREDGTLRTYRYGLGLATFPTPCGRARGHTGNVQGRIGVAWNTRDADRQVVLVVNVYPLSGELEAAVRRLQDAAFCRA